MTQLHIIANQVAIRANEKTGRVEIELWSQAADSVASLSREEALQKIADMVQAVAALGKPDAVQN